MRLTFLILLALMCACESEAQMATTTSDGRAGYHVTADDGRTTCLAMAGRYCKYGFDIVQEECKLCVYSCSMIVACHPINSTNK